MTSDFKALWAAVMAAPLDDAPKLVLADYLQERGLDPHLERGLRWCVANGKWPWPMRTRAGWVWLGESDGDMGRSSLPVRLDRKIIRSDGWRAKNLATLVRRVGKVLEKLNA